MPILLENSSGVVLTEPGARVLLEHEAVWEPQIALIMGNLRVLRWLTVADLSRPHNYPYPYFSMPCAWHGWDLARGPRLGDPFFTLFFCSEFAENWQPGLTFVKPSGRLLRVTHCWYGMDRVVGAAIPSWQFVAYTFETGDLDETGEWSVYLTAGSGAGRFVVTR